MNTVLRDRWLQLWSGLGYEGDALALYEDLERRYSEPHRAYHTLAHLEHCFRELNEAFRDDDGISLGSNARVTVELALWYHDVFYDTRANDNEERSALFAEQVLTEARCFYANPGLVASYIRVTAHTKEPLFFDEKLVLDVDLAILGQPEEAFDEYERQIRLEYEWVPADAFRSGRAAVLQRFLDRTTIYNLQYFQRKYEARARENLKRSLSALT
ncbi:MAG: N-methyl-D-aspartate receptor NMDAR2C subunit [Patescibacteria group bacterium]